MRIIIKRKKNYSYRTRNGSDLREREREWNEKTVYEWIFKGKFEEKSKKATDGSNWNAYSHGSIGKDENWEQKVK